MKNRSIIISKNGFSLLEIIVAMLILSIVTAGSFSLYVTAQKFLTDARIRTQMAERTSSVLEELNGRVAAGAILTDSLTEILQREGLDGQCSYQVEDNNDISGQTVTLTLRWDGA